MDTPHLIAKIVTVIAITGTLLSIISFLLKKWVERMMIQYTAYRYLAKIMAGDAVFWQELKELYEKETHGNLTQHEGHLIMKSARQILLRKHDINLQKWEQAIAETDKSIPGNLFSDPDINCSLNILTWLVIGMFVLLPVLRSEAPRVIDLVIATVLIVFPSLFFIGLTIYGVNSLLSNYKMLQSVRHLL